VRHSDELTEPGYLGLNPINSAISSLSSAPI
jgi:hypothetical protein